MGKEAAPPNRWAPPGRPAIFGRILSRYIFWQTAGALVAILVSLTSVVWIGVALRQLELMTSQGQDALRFLVMTTLAIPSMLALIAPIALLIACIHVLNRLNGDSELIVMTAGGAPVWALLKPLGLLAVLVAYRRVVRQSRGGSVEPANAARVHGPRAHRSHRAGDSALALHRAGVEADAAHSRSRRRQSARASDARRPRCQAGRSYLAERAQVLKQGNAPTCAWRTATSCVAPRRTRRRRSLPSPNTWSTSISSSSAPTSRSAIRPRERYTPDLLWPDPNDQSYKASPGQVRIRVA